MKIPCLLLLAILFASCSKNTNNTPTLAQKNSVIAVTAVDYEFSSNVSGTFSINYSDANNNIQTISVTGTTWSEKFNLLVSGTGSIGFIVTDSNGVTTTGTASVAVNGGFLLSKSYSMSPSNPTLNMVSAFDN